MSEKSVAMKLGLKPGGTIRLINQPKDRDGWLGALPAGAKIITKGQGPFALIVLFVDGRTALERDLAPARAMLGPGGALWVAYAKLTSKSTSDLNRDSLSAYGASLGLDSVAIIAIDKDYSALRFKVIA